MIKIVFTEHYYGNIVRRLFLLAGIIILITLPILHNKIPAPFLFSIFGVIIISLFAGLTNPTQEKVAFFDAAISAIALLIFEYYAVLQYQAVTTVNDLFFLANQVLALVFFFALYYSIKTLRGMLLDK